MKLRALASFALTSILAFGCAANTATPAETEGATQEEVTAAKAIVGSWDADKGSIYQIDFTSDYAETLGGFVKGHRFIARVDNGVRCITAPCPSDEVVSGVYVVKSNKVTLDSFDRPDLALSRILGEYKLTVTAKKLTLKKSDGTFDGAFHPTPSCGKHACGVGTVCCNPVMSVCAAPGKVCIQ